MLLQQRLNELKFTTKQKDVFEKLGLYTLNDLILMYPRRYNFLLETPLIDNQKVVIEAKINSEINISFFQGRKNRIYFDVVYEGRILKVVIFNRSFMLNNLKKASIITIVGTYTEKNNTIIASEIKLSDLKSISGIYPVYSLNNLYKNGDYIKIMKNVLEKGNLEIENIISDDLVVKYQLLNRKDAINNIHFPKDKNLLLQANRTLIYEEFFLFAIHCIIEKESRLSDNSLVKDINISDLSNLVNNLKYTLTNDQRNVLNEIFVDFKSNQAMNRLLLADVGSGKTLVAFIAAYMIYMSGYQSAFMAPTTILAMQHYQSALEIFENVEINVVLLTSNTNPHEREQILADLKKGKIDLIIGTHALYQDDVEFKNLGFVIYDEQQRFGVKQRQQLKEKGKNVEQLMLSATPIPRTLAQVAYASLQVSYMKEPLPFKKPIKSYYFKSKSIKPFYDEMISLLEQHQQIYIVTPLIEESETQDTKNAIDVYESIKKHFKDKYTVDLIHGKLDNDEKQEAMDRFLLNETNILVATSLIEVGISVDNATCIVIYDAHRFGLSQLHQLRGRVGRGSLQGYCVFLSTSSEEDTIKKMEFIASTNDGFAIAEFDLETRGPGDILGVKQSGLPSFNIANPFKDEKIYNIAYQDALNLYQNKEELKKWYLKNKNTIELLTSNINY
ncbi:ATP-dependent DNA helicase RecG [Bacilli bacterium PM5-3]|nr:ATP-dependent DNA helicase RecG [Bacilli bacterium PM5-3]MDH6603043.1 ATP-dependent DNA helicase RecG [Bacilli bacterium PM5-9]